MLEALGSAFGGMAQYLIYFVWLIFQLVIFIAFYLWLVRLIGFKASVVIRERLLKQPLTDEEKEAFGSRERAAVNVLKSALSFIKKDKER